MERTESSNPPVGPPRPGTSDAPAAAEPGLVLNPRRSPRLRLCCPARISSGEATWDAQTEDVGPRGCQLVSPRPVTVRESLQLVVSCAATADLSVPGAVVWASPAAPFRLGVAFAPQHAGATARWFDDLVSAGAGYGAGRYVRGIAADATLFLGRPPRFCPDFTPDEAAIVLAVAAGVTAGELRARLHATWRESRHALFSLVARNLVTTERAEAVPVARWRLFRDHLATLAQERRRRSEPPAARPERPRPADAQALLDDARILIANGRTASGITALREALVRAPRDADIAAALFRVAWDSRGGGR